MCIGAVAAIHHLIDNTETFVQPIAWAMGFAIIERRARGAAPGIKLYWTDLVLIGVIVATIAQVWIDRRWPFFGDLTVLIAILAVVSALAPRQKFPTARIHKEMT